MTGKQQAVMWMGLILIVLRLFTTNQWSDIWKTVLKGGGNKEDSLLRQFEKGFEEGWKSFDIPFVPGITAPAQPDTPSGSART